MPPGQEKKKQAKKNQKANSNLLDGCQTVLAASSTIGLSKRLLSAGTIAMPTTIFTPAPLAPQITDAIT